MPTSTKTRKSESEKKEQLTSYLLRTVTSQASNDGVLLANGAIGGALSPILGLRSSYLALSSRVFVAARLLPIGRTGQVTDCLDNSAFDGVELAGRLPA